jgi:hypothetical protein
MKYDEHRHDGTTEPGEHFDSMGQAAPGLHELLKVKGFDFEVGADYYSFGKDEDWQQHNPLERPLICVYKSGTWDGRPVPGYPMKPNTELKDYLDSLPDVQRAG